MVAIQPDNARAAAAHLRTRAAIAGELDLDLRRAARLSELDASSELAACAEIEEELVMLARILAAKADEAEGFFLPGNTWQLASFLLGSLLDDRGATAAMSGPIALHLLMEQGRAAAVDGSNPTTTDNPLDSLVFTVAGLRALADDPASSPELAAAAIFLARNPTIVEVTAAWEGTGAILPSHGIDEVPLRDIEAFLERNGVLRQLLGNNDTIAPHNIYADLDDSTLLAAGIDPEHFDDLALPRSGHDLLVTAINHGTFNHSPTVARNFVRQLPAHYLDRQGIDIRSTDPDAIERLYESATIDLGDSPEGFITRALVVASLPESTAGTRNELITSNYAEVAAWQNTLLNGSTPAADPNYRGNNWFHLGTSASDSVSPVIEGRQRTFTGSAFGHTVFPGFGTPHAVDQDVADGNQAIYHHFMTALANLWQTGSTDLPRLDSAFALLDEAAAADDVVEAQHLVAESTVLFAIEEQIVVDPYLQLDGLGFVDEVGALAITTAGALLSNSLAGRPLTDGSSPVRTAAQVMTDDGQLTVTVNGEDAVEPMPIGEAVRRPTHTNNFIDPDALAVRLPDDFDWTQTQADDWTFLDQRMPVIEDVAILTLTEPAFHEMVADRIQGNLASPH